MKNKYTPFILSAKGKALVLLGALAILAAGIIGVTQARDIDWSRTENSMLPKVPRYFLVFRDTGASALKYATRKFRY